MIDRDLRMKMDLMLNPYKAGEYELKKYLWESGADVEDVSNNPNYWYKDIDIIADGITIEIKWDAVISTTGNMYIETLSDIDKNKPGWFTFC